MNQLSTNATVMSVVDSVRTTVSTNQNTQTSSSNFIAGNAVVTGSVWTAITLGTLDDVIGMTFYNDSSVYSQSVISVALGAAGTPVATTLIPGAQAIIPWSGSMPTVSARVVGSYPPFISGSDAGAANQWGKGNVQFLAQQS